MSASTALHFSRPSRATVTARRPLLNKIDQRFRQWQSIAVRTASQQNNVKSVVPQRTSAFRRKGHATGSRPGTRRSMCAQALTQGGEKRTSVPTNLALVLLGKKPEPARRTAKEEQQTLHHRRHLYSAEVRSGGPQEIFGLVRETDSQISIYFHPSCVIKEHITRFRWNNALFKLWN